jgi:hypothetical protein
MPSYFDPQISSEDAKKWIITHLKMFNQCVPPYFGCKEAVLMYLKDEIVAAPMTEKSKTFDIQRKDVQAPESIVKYLEERLDKLEGLRRKRTFLESQIEEINLILVKHKDIVLPPKLEFKVQQKEIEKVNVESAMWNKKLYALKAYIHKHKKMPITTNWRDETVALQKEIEKGIGQTKWNKKLHALKAYIHKHKKMPSTANWRDETACKLASWVSCQKNNPPKYHDHAKWVCFWAAYTKKVKLWDYEANLEGLVRENEALKIRIQEMELDMIESKNIISPLNYSSS